MSNRKLPYIISLSSNPKENEDDYHESEGLNSIWLR